MSVGDLEDRADWDVVVVENEAIDDTTALRIAHQRTGLGATFPSLDENDLFPDLDDLGDAEGADAFSIAEAFSKAPAAPLPRPSRGLTRFPGPGDEGYQESLGDTGLAAVDFEPPPHDVDLEHRFDPRADEEEAALEEAEELALFPLDPAGVLAEDADGPAAPSEELDYADVFGPVDDELPPSDLEPTAPPPAPFPVVRAADPAPDPAAEPLQEAGDHYADELATAGQAVFPALGRQAEESEAAPEPGHLAPIDDEDEDDDLPPWTPLSGVAAGAEGSPLAVSPLAEGRVGRHRARPARARRRRQTALLVAVWVAIGTFVLTSRLLDDGEQAEVVQTEATTTTEAGTSTTDRGSEAAAAVPVLVPGTEATEATEGAEPEAEDKDEAKREDKEEAKPRRRTGGGTASNPPPPPPPPPTNPPTTARPPATTTTTRPTTTTTEATTTTTEATTTTTEATTTTTAGS